MVLIESVKSVRLTLLAMTLLSLTMLSWFIMDLKLKKGSTHLRMMKMHATENCSGNLKGNSNYSSTQSQQDTARVKENNAQYKK